MLLFGLLDILDSKFPAASSKQLLKESMDSKISYCTYFNKDIEHIGPITSFVRYCVELSHRVGGVICNENHTLFTAYCTKNYRTNLIFELYMFR